MLDELSEFEISKIYVTEGTNDFINNLAQRPMFKTKQDLFKVLELKESKIRRPTQTLEYMSKMEFPERFNMS